MNHTWLNWLLAGALLASLQWNMRSKTGAVSPAGTSGAAACELDFDALGMTAQQAEAFARLCSTRCAAVDELETRADAALAELHRELSAADLDRQQLLDDVREISRLREESLVALVDSIIGVREILTPEQLAVVMESCCRVDAQGEVETCSSCEDCDSCDTTDRTE